MKTPLDQFNRPFDSIHHGSPFPSFCEWETDGAITYLRVSPTAETLIQKVTETTTGGVIEWACGAWENRATLTYKPANGDELRK